MFGGLMPRRKKSKIPTKYILIVVIVVGVSGLGIVALHDGLIGTTPLGSINDLTVTGPVVVRAKITNIAGQSILISDGTGAATFTWYGPATVGTTVVVRAEVNSAHTLKLVSAVEPVWFFQLP
jgi:hypothetical protein